MVGIFVIMRWLTFLAFCGFVYNSVLRSSVNLCLLTSYLTLSSGHLGEICGKTSDNIFDFMPYRDEEEFYYSSAGLGYWVGELHWCCAKYDKWIPYLNPTTIFSGIEFFLFYLIWRKWLFPWSHSSKTYPIIFSCNFSGPSTVGIFWGSH